MRAVRYLKYIASIAASPFVDALFVLYSFRWRILGPRYYFHTRMYPNFLKSGDAKAFIEDYALEFCKGNGLDVGAGRYPLRGARGIDDAVENAANIRQEDGSVDFIFSSHTLEHVPEVEPVLREFSRVIRKGGILFLYLPHPTISMWLPKNFVHHRRTLPPREIRQSVESVGFKVAEMTYVPDVYFSYFIVAEKQ